MRILIVDDKPDIATMLTALLELEGHTVEYAGNGHAALSRLRMPPWPDTVLLDLCMPIYSGEDFMKELVKDERLATLPLIVMTALAEVPPTRVPAGAHVVAFLSKPFEVATLLAVLAKIAADNLARAKAGPP